MSDTRRKSTANPSACTEKGSAFIFLHEVTADVRRGTGAAAADASRADVDLDTNLCSVAESESRSDRQSLLALSTDIALRLEGGGGGEVGSVRCYEIEARRGWLVVC